MARIKDQLLALKVLPRQVTEHGLVSSPFRHNHARGEEGGQILRQVVWRNFNNTCPASGNGRLDFRIGVFKTSLMPWPKTLR